MSTIEPRPADLARQAASFDPLEGTRTVRAGETAWVEIAPFVEVRELHRDELAGLHTSLMRMRPGGVIPAHRHERRQPAECAAGRRHAHGDADAAL